MKYAVIQCVNGSFSISSEWDNPEKAIHAFHSVCSALWNTAERVEADVKLVNGHLETVKGYHDIIVHDAKE